MYAWQSEDYSLKARYEDVKITVQQKLYCIHGIVHYTRTQYDNIIIHIISQTTAKHASCLFSNYTAVQMEYRDGGDKHGLGDINWSWI